jgi:hypothetical protein
LVHEGKSKYRDSDFGSGQHARAANENASNAANVLVGLDIKSKGYLRCSDTKTAIVGIHGYLSLVW